MQIVLATHNQHKVDELRRILEPKLPGVEVLAYDGPEPVESGTTFAENALIKARAAAAHTGLPAIADDSGICVDVLGGSPGIFSARWAGPGKDANDNLHLLLSQLADIPDEHRAAHFTCVAALALPDLGASAAAWVLPALALAAGALALATWLRVEVAVATLGAGWLLAVATAWWVAGREAPVADAATFAVAGQLTALLVAGVGVAVVAARRDRFATLEAFR